MNPMLEKMYVPPTEFVWANVGLLEKIDIKLEDFIEVTISGCLLDQKSKQELRENIALARIALIYKATLK